MRLAAGDVLVVPHGRQYALTSEPGLRTGFSDADTLRWFREMSSGRMPFVVGEGGDGPERIEMVCGFLGCDALPFNPVLATLPALLRIRLPAADGDDRLGRAARVRAGRVPARAAGGQSVLLRIAELVFVEVLRAHLMALPATPAAGSAGLRDPWSAGPWRDARDAGRALDAGAARPRRRRFAHRPRRAVRAFTGLPPMVYLPGWRMQLAAARLGSGPHGGGVARPLATSRKRRSAVRSSVAPASPRRVAAHRAGRAAGAAAARSPRQLTVGRLGCARDNQPYIVPISFYFDPAGRCLYSFATAGQKIDWMRSNPRVCLEVDEIGDEFHWNSVLVIGRFEELVAYHADGDAHEQDARTSSSSARSDRCPASANCQPAPNTSRR